MKRRSSFDWVARVSLVIGALHPWALAQTIPAVHGTTFSGAPVSLPESLHGRPAVLVLGFTQGSREAITAWGKRLAADYNDAPSVLYYEMPMLASVPRPLRSFVAGRIKSSVSDRGRVHFIPLTDHEAEWKSLSHFQAPDDAYLLVVDGQGTVRWQTHGNATDAAYSAMKRQLQGLDTSAAATSTR
jgi:hypothetical protein